MEYKDTVMGQWTIKNKHGVDFGYEVWKTIHPLLAAQAEITWKAGQREVVEWIRKANQSGDFYCSFNQADLEAKLKEWGL